MVKWKYYRESNLWRAFWVEERNYSAFCVRDPYTVLDCVAVIFAIKMPRRPGGRPVVVGYKGEHVHAESGYTIRSVKVSDLESPRIVRKRLVNSIKASLRRYACECGSKVPACLPYALDAEGIGRPHIRWAHHVCAKDWPGRKVDILGATVLPEYEETPPIVGEAPSVNPNDGRDPLVASNVPHEDPIGNPSCAAGGGCRPSSSARSQDDGARPVGFRNSDKAFVELYDTLFDRPAEASRANGASYLRSYECEDLRERVSNILSLLREINEAEANDV